MSKAQQMELDRPRVPHPAPGVWLLAAQEAWELGVPHDSREQPDFNPS